MSDQFSDALNAALDTFERECREADGLTKSKKTAAYKAARSRYLQAKANLEQGQGVMLR